MRWNFIHKHAVLLAAHTGRHIEIHRFLVSFERRKSNDKPSDTDDKIPFNQSPSNHSWRTSQRCFGIAGDLYTTSMSNRLSWNTWRKGNSSTQFLQVRESPEIIFRQTENHSFCPTVKSCVYVCVYRYSSHLYSTVYDHVHGDHEIAEYGYLRVIDELLPIHNLCHRRQTILSYLVAADVLCACWWSIDCFSNRNNSNHDYLLHNRIVWSDSVRNTFSHLIGIAGTILSWLIPSITIFLLNRYRMRNVFNEGVKTRTDETARERLIDVTEMHTRTIQSVSRAGLIIPRENIPNCQV